MTKLVFKFVFAGAVTAVLLGAGDAHAFGDEPYWPGFGNRYEPAIASGCWRWNWQQYSWYDHCPSYVRPKAYMYPRSYRVAVRAKG